MLGVAEARVVFCAGVVGEKVYAAWGGAGGEGKRR